MKLEFTKMHGCGNDYIYFNCFDKEIPNPGSLSKKLSDRRYSIGADGIILICRSNVADAKMRMFNSDGSEGKMCGNGIRCVGKYLYDNNMVNSDVITIETLSGIKTLKAIKEGSEVIKLTVDMGKAIFDPKLIPVSIDTDKVINYPITISNTEYKINCVSMGNPHCVVFCDEIDNIVIEKIGPEFENNKLFKERINTEFVEIINNKTLKMRVWERGSGETLACGTGACAVVAAAVQNGICDKNEDIIVKLKGGDLLIRYTDETVYMTGNAIKVYEGVIEV